ncbi:MAG: hypothetical protein R3F56_09780 [Planctomycetota bacterium]
MRRIALFLCMCLPACRGAAPLPRRADTAAADAPGEVARDTEGCYETAVRIARGEVPRAALVTIEAVQPDGEAVILERVWRDGRNLYRATSHYPAPLPPTRTVLVDAAGGVYERAYTLDWHRVDAEFGEAAATLRNRLGGTPSRVDLVAGEDGDEWLRAYRNGADARAAVRIVECGPSGEVRG